MSERWGVFDIAFLGTSLTANSICYWQPTFRANLQQSSVRPVRLYDFGHPGAVAANLVADSAAIVRMRPRLVVIEVGMNDAYASVDLTSFGNDVTTIIDNVRAADATTLVALMTMNPAISPAPSYQIAALPDYYQKLRDLAASKATALIDNTPTWGSPTDTQIPDGVHPTHDEAVRVIVPNASAVIGPLIA
jgi:lysophospholipase L1-like esterase